MGSNEPPVRLRAISPRWTTLRRRSGQAWVDWLKGAGFLVFHIDVFLVAIAVLLLLNIARSPDHIWVAGVFGRWGLLLVIHGMVTLLIWLIAMLLTEERPGTGTYEAEWSTLPRDMAPEPVVIEPVVIEPVEADGGANHWTPPSENGTTPASPPDEVWTAPDAAPAPANDWHAGFEQRTSWAETSASAWLSRRRRERNATSDGPAQQPQDGA